MGVNGVLVHEIVAKVYGTSVKFWEDVWCRDCSLKVAFPKFYRFSRASESFVSEVIICFFDGRIH